MAALPPARLASAMLAAEGGGGSDAQDSGLVSRLEWLRGWTQRAAESDADATCRSMAAACQRLQASLAAGAMAALQNGGGRGGVREGGLLPAAEVQLPGGGGRTGLSIELPKLQELKLPR